MRLVGRCRHRLSQFGSGRNRSAAWRTAINEFVQNLRCFRVNSLTPLSEERQKFSSGGQFLWAAGPVVKPLDAPSHGDGKIVEAAKPHTEVPFGLVDLARNLFAGIPISRELGSIPHDPLPRN